MKIKRIHLHKYFQNIGGDFMKKKKLLSITASTLLLTFCIGGFNTTKAAGTPKFQMPFPCGQKWEGQTRSNHSPANSVDFNRANDEGDTVVASASGTVSRVENEGNRSYGKWIEINHGDGWTTRYAHLSTQSVKKGQKVTIGQKIGTVGNTGGSTGAHLHFEQRYQGQVKKIAFNGSQIHYWGTKSYTSENSCKK